MNVLVGDRSETPDTAVAGSRSVGRNWRIVIAVLLVVGLALRIWTMYSKGGVLDSDEAVVGLMARHPGQLSTFFWGQSYGGSHEAMLATLLFALLGPTTFALRTLTILLSAGVTFLVWRLGRRFLDPTRAALAAVLFWIWPAAFVWWSVKLGSDYWAGLGLALLAILAALRIRDEARWPVWDVAALGFLVGLAWWANPQTMYYVLPGLLLLVPSAVGNWRRLPVMAVTAVAGALPWLIYNVRNHWQSLVFPGPPPGLPDSYVDHLRGLVHWSLPMALGLRMPFTRAWVLGSVGRVAYAALLAGMVVLLVRRPRPLRVLLLVAVAFPLIYAESPATWYVDQPRYVLFAAPTICLLIGAGLRSPRVAGAILTAAALLTFGGLRQINDRFLPRNYVPDVPVPASLKPLEALMHQEKIGRAFADYWLAYRVTFETRERALVSPTYVVRDRRIDQAVRDDPRPAYLFVAGASPLARLTNYCHSQAIPYDELHRGPFVVIHPARKVLPEQVPGGWFPPPA